MKHPNFIINNQYINNEYYQNFLLTSQENRRLLKEKVEKQKSSLRMSNEELLYKLSNLLQVPIKETNETPEEHEHEEEAFEEDKQYIERAASQRNPWGRKPFSLF